MKLLTSAFKITWVEVILGHIKKKENYEKGQINFFFFEIDQKNVKMKLLRCLS